MLLLLQHYLLHLLFVVFALVEEIAELGFVEGNLAGALAHRELRECKHLGLVEDVGEERSGSIVSCEVLLEDEDLVNVVEDSMEEGTQQVRFAVDLRHFMIYLFIDPGPYLCRHLPKTLFFPRGRIVDFR
jgi:hypothetical protein